MQNTLTKTSEVVITRVFNASRDLVWKAWTEPERMKQWWGPRNYWAPVIKIDLRIGGEILSSMRSPEGKDIWGKGTYKEIVKDHKLVMTDSFADEKGDIVSATHYGMSPYWPRELLITVTFEDVKDGTRMILRHSGLKGAAEEDVKNMEQGWNESFDKLAEYLKKG